MNYILSIAVIMSTLAIPAYAESAAESFGSNKGPFVVSASAQSMAEDLLETTVVESSANVSRGFMSAGQIQLANSMNVDPIDYSVVELTQMHLSD